MDNKIVVLHVSTAIWAAQQNIHFSDSDRSAGLIYIMNNAFIRANLTTKQETILSTLK